MPYLSGNYGPDTIDRNRYASQYGQVYQNPGIGPNHNGFFNQFASALTGGGVMNPLMNMMTGGIGGLLSTGLNMFTQAWQNRQSEKMWNMENEYNSPQAQIQRFLDAGINPAAAVSAVTGQPNTAGSLQPGSNPSVAPDLMSMFGNSANNSMQQALTQSQTEVEKANVENIKANTELTKSQNVAQEIENANRQDVIDSTLRKLQDEHVIDNQTAHALMRDNVMQDMLFDGKITQFWLQVAQAAQDLQNAEAEHDRILADINLKYEEIALDAQLIVESDARTQKTMKEKEIAEENRRYMAFRRNCISQYHWDPNSSVQQNIGFALSIGDTETADYWMRHLGRVQAEVDGWSTEQKGYMSQQFQGYQGIIDMSKYMAGGYAAGSGLSGSKVPGQKGVSGKDIEKGLKESGKHRPKRLSDQLNEYNAGQYGVPVGGVSYEYFR